MLRELLAISVIVASAPAVFGAVDATAASGKLSAVEIANRNVEVRGGLNAWRAVKAISESGKLGAGGDQREAVAAPTLTPPPGAKKKAAPVPASPRLAKEAQLPFLMEMERPRKVRLEVQFEGKTAIQVYDGANGWKVRPFLNRLEVEPFTDEELKLASMQPDLDGPLVDYAAKGTHVELEGMETVENHPAYKLKLTMKNGKITHVWVDSQTFLESKIEGEPRKLDGKIHPVEVYYRDYRKVDGLEIPFILETRVLPVQSLGLKQTNYPPEQIIIDKVQINPRLDSAQFTKPVIQDSTVRHTGF